MSTEIPDPLVEWQKLIRDAESRINAMSGDIAGRSDFSRMMNEVLQLSMFAQTSFGEHMERMLTAMRIPTESQMGEIIERLDRLEEKIDRLGARGTAGAGRDAPPRTRRPSAT